MVLSLKYNCQPAVIVFSALGFLYQFSVRLHIILTPPNLPLVRGGAAGGGVVSMRLHMEMV